MLTVSYDSVNDVSTITVSASTLPDGGGYFYVEVPGDNTSSYRGDYLASSGFTTSHSDHGRTAHQHASAPRRRHAAPDGAGRGHPEQRHGDRHDVRRYAERV